MHVYNPSDGEMEADMPLGLTGQPDEPTWWVPSQWGALLKTKQTNQKNPSEGNSTWELSSDFPPSIQKEQLEGQGVLSLGYVEKLVS